MTSILFGACGFNNGDVWRVYHGGLFTSNLHVSYASVKDSKRNWFGAWHAVREDDDGEKIVIVGR